VLPNISKASGTQKRVAQRMQHNVPVRVGEYSVRMGHPHAAKHYEIAGPEGVNVNS
jgi:hypothetical protein